MEQTTMGNQRETFAKATILYVRQPGLLAHAAAQARSGRSEGGIVAVAEGRIVRDASAPAVACGVHPGMSVVRARRLCPALLAIPREQVDYEPLSRCFLDALADLSPVVEPLEPDAACADLAGTPPDVRGADLCALRERLHALGTGTPPLLGLGVSRLAARACAECGLPPDRFAEADVRWLWPEDERVVARLQRLGLTTAADVAALEERHLVYQFGARVGRPLHRRSHGQDFTPVRALYPPPRADARKDFCLEPIEDAARLDAELERMAQDAAGQLSRLGRIGRRVRLGVTQEGVPTAWRECLPPLPVQSADSVQTAARRLLARNRIVAPVTELRLLVEELELPAAVTARLFEERQSGGGRAVEAVRRLLCARYGSGALSTLGKMPLPERDRRRQAAREWRQAAGV